MVCRHKCEATRVFKGGPYRALAIRVLLRTAVAKGSYTNCVLGDTSKSTQQFCFRPRGGSGRREILATDGGGHSRPASRTEICCSKLLSPVQASFTLKGAGFLSQEVMATLPGFPENPRQGNWVRAFSCIIKTNNSRSKYEGECLTCAENGSVKAGALERHVLEVPQERTWRALDY